MVETQLVNSKFEREFKDTSNDLDMNVMTPKSDIETQPLISEVDNIVRPFDELELLRLRALASAGRRQLNIPEIKRLNSPTSGDSSELEDGQLRDEAPYSSNNTQYYNLAINSDHLNNMDYKYSTLNIYDNNLTQSNNNSHIVFSTNEFLDESIGAPIINNSLPSPSFFPHRNQSVRFNNNVHDFNLRPLHKQDHTFLPQYGLHVSIDSSDDELVIPKKFEGIINPCEPPKTSEFSSNFPPSAHMLSTIQDEISKQTLFLEQIKGNILKLQEKMNEIDHKARENNNNITNYIAQQAQLKASLKANRQLIKRGKFIKSNFVSRKSSISKDITSKINLVKDISDAINRKRSLLEFYTLGSTVSQPSISVLLNENSCILPDSIELNSTADLLQKPNFAPHHSDVSRFTPISSSTSINPPVFQDPSLSESVEEPRKRLKECKTVELVEQTESVPKNRSEQIAFLEKQTLRLQQSLVETQISILNKKNLHSRQAKKLQTDPVIEHKMISILSSARSKLVQPINTGDLFKNTIVEVKSAMTSPLRISEHTILSTTLSKILKLVVGLTCHLKNLSLIESPIAVGNSNTLHSSLKSKLDHQNVHFYDSFNVKSSSQCLNSKKSDQISKFTHYISPLACLKSYRFNPNFLHLVPKQGLLSRTYTNLINPRVSVCSSDLSGRCRDTGCTFQHFRTIFASDSAIIEDLALNLLLLTPPDSHGYSIDLLRRRVFSKPNKAHGTKSKVKIPLIGLASVIVFDAYVAAFQKTNGKDQLNHLLPDSPLNEEFRTPGRFKFILPAYTSVLNAGSLNVSEKVRSTVALISESFKSSTNTNDKLKGPSNKDSTSKSSKLDKRRIQSCKFFTRCIGSLIRENFDQLLLKQSRYFDAMPIENSTITNDRAKNDDSHRIETFFSLLLDSCRLEKQGTKYVSSELVQSVLQLLEDRLIPVSRAPCLDNLISGKLNINEMLSDTKKHYVWYNFLLDLKTAFKLDSNGELCYVLPIYPFLRPTIESFVSSIYHLIHSYTFTEHLTNISNFVKCLIFGLFKCFFGTENDQKSLGQSQLKLSIMNTCLDAIMSGTLKRESLEQFEFFKSESDDGKSFRIDLSMYHEDEIRSENFLKIDIDDRISLAILYINVQHKKVIPESCFYPSPMDYVCLPESYSMLTFEGISLDSLDLAIVRRILETASKEQLSGTNCKSGLCKKVEWILNIVHGHCDYKLFGPDNKILADLVTQAFPTPSIMIAVDLLDERNCTDLSEHSMKQMLSHPLCLLTKLSSIMKDSSLLQSSSEDFQTLDNVELAVEIIESYWASLFGVDDFDIVSTSLLDLPNNQTYKRPDFLLNPSEENLNEHDRHLKIRFIVLQMVMRNLGLAHLLPMNVMSPQAVALCEKATEVFCSNQTDPFFWFVVAITVSLSYRHHHPGNNGPTDGNVFSKSPPILFPILDICTKKNKTIGASNLHLSVLSIRELVQKASTVCAASPSNDDSTLILLQCLQLGVKSLKKQAIKRIMYIYESGDCLGTHKITPGRQIADALSLVVPLGGASSAGSIVAEWMMPDDIHGRTGKSEISSLVSFLRLESDHAGKSFLT